MLEEEGERGPRVVLLSCVRSHVVMRVQVGQCVSLRAEPRADDPRTEWPAVIRHIYFHRNGYPKFLVTWLDPTFSDRVPYAQFPAGPHQQVWHLSEQLHS